jgi:hypothetical protein
MNKSLLSLTIGLLLTTSSFCQYEWNTIAPLKFTNLSFNVEGQDWSFPTDLYDTQEGDDGVVQPLSWNATQPRPETWQAMIIRQDAETGNFSVRVEMGIGDPTPRYVGFDYVGSSLDNLQLQGSPSGQYLDSLPNGSFGWITWTPSNNIPSSFNLMEKMYGENLEDWFSYRGMNVSIPVSNNQSNSDGLNTIFFEQAKELNTGLEFRNGQWTPLQ